MAGVLTITDGTDTVDLLDTTAFFLKRGGWREKVANENERGDYDDLIEVITLTWMETEDDSRATTIQKLKRLAKKAAEFVREQKLTDHVYLSASTHSETKTRYAVIKHIQIDELHKGHWGPDQVLESRIIVTREGTWRALAPGSALTSDGATTIFNKQDADGNNFLTVANTTVTGDVDADTNFVIDFIVSNTREEFILALKTGTLPDLDKFNPHFNANDELDNVGSQVADTVAPDDIALEFAGAGNITMRWILDNNLEFYAGAYLVFCAVRADTADLATIHLAHGDESDDGDPVAVPSQGSFFARLYLGRFDIPAGGFIPGLTAPASYDMKMELTKSGTVTVRFSNFWLVPIDEGVFSADNVNLNTFIAFDGDIERVYELATATGPPIAFGFAQPGGKYIELKPGLTNRVYFYTKRSDLEVTPNDSISVTVRYLLRYTSLRGNN